MHNLKRITIIVFSMLLMLSFAQAAFADDAQKININKASSAELCKLKNIGPACAERIIKYREANGPFEKPEDLVKVKGPKGELNRRIHPRVKLEIGDDKVELTVADGGRESKALHGLF